MKLIVKFLINLTASSTSVTSTVSASRIFARASEIRIIDSNYLGVAVIVFFALPILLIDVYSPINALSAASEILGCAHLRA